MFSQKKLSRWFAIGAVLLCALGLSAQTAPEIIQAEYFYDTDPGAGNATPLTATYNQAIVTASQSGISGLSTGLHTINVRYLGIDNTWGPVFKTVVSIAANYSDSSAITAGEYFIDTDPGNGNATPLLAFGGNFPLAVQSVLNSAIAVPSTGLHTLNVRMKDVKGNWSPTYKTVFNVDAGFSDSTNITTAEYFFDSDPGNGNGTPMLAFNGNFPNAVQSAIKSGVSAPSLGLHTLNIRIKDIKNNWSPVFKTVLNIDTTYSAYVNVVQGEYFFDVDPGNGNGNPVIALDGQFNNAIEQVKSDPSVNTLSTGVHTLNVRVLGIGGTWGPKYTVVFNIEACSPLPTVAITPSAIQTICSGDSVLLTAAATGTGITYRWRFNGSNISGATASTYYASVAGVYDVAVRNSSGCGSASNKDTIVYSQGAVTPAVIINSNAGTTICAGTAVTFTASPANGGNTPSYQWYVNTLPVGTNSPTYVTSSLTNGANVYCVMTSSANCLTSSIATSNTLNITVNSAVTPSVTISASPGSSVCSGINVNFTASPSNGGTLPSYTWKKNGNTVGFNNNTYADNTLVNGDLISCIMTSNAACPTQASDTSNIITMAVTQTLAPTIVLSANPGTGICNGMGVTFNTTVTNQGTNPTYQWKKNSFNTGTGGTSYIDNALSNGDVITCELTSNQPCANPVSVTSAPLTITVAASVTPTVAIAANPGTTICSGTSVTFTATANNGGSTPAYEWKKNGFVVGTNSATYTDASLVQSDAITCQLTSNHPCASVSMVSSNTLTITVSSSVTPGVSIAANPGTTICAGNSVTFTATPANGGSNPVYQWRKNGNTVGGSSNSYTDAGLVNGDAITCRLNSANSCAVPDSAISNTLTITVTASSPAGVSITSGAGNSICSGASVTFTATPTNGGSSPSYQWKKNTLPVGANSNTYTDAGLANGDAVICEMTSNSSCASPLTATSNSITITATNTVTPDISINASQTTICTGASVTFTASAINGGNAPAYQWKKNGVNVGINSSGYSDNSLANGDVIRCVLTGNALCATTNTDTSNSITITVVSQLTPSVNISANPAGAVCTGTNVTFTATANNEGNAPVYAWKLNGITVGSNASTYSNSSLNNGDIVICILTSNASCLSTTTDTSNVITMSVGSSITPTISIAASETSVCTGATVIFTATPSGGGSTPAYQWKLNNNNVGTGSDTLKMGNMANGDAVSCTMVSSSGCANPGSAVSNIVTITVSGSVTPSITVSPSSPSVCAGANVTFTAVAANGGSSPAYQWKKNGNNVGSNTSTYQDNTLTNPDVITCQLTSNASCASPLTVTSSGVSIAINPAPTATITPNGTVNVCQNDSVQLQATAGSPSYLWSTGAIGQSIWAKFAGNYTVTVTNINNCSAASAPATVVVNLLPAVPVITRVADTLTSTAAVGYQWYFSGNEINGANGQSVVMTANGQYKVEITDTNSCKNSSAIFNAANVGVPGMETNWGVSLFPNPNRGSFTLRFTDAVVRTLAITDALGRIVLSETKVHGTHQFNVEPLAAGIYFIRIEQNKWVKTLKFTVIE